jgi:hypothetical protein
MPDNLLTPDSIANEVRELAALLAQSDTEREVIEAALVSVITAMGRAAPEAQAELQALMADFTANPDDKQTVARLGAFLAAAGRKFH